MIQVCPPSQAYQSSESGLPVRGIPVPLVPVFALTFVALDLQVRVRVSLAVGPAIRCHDRAVQGSRNRSFGNSRRPGPNHRDHHTSTVLAPAARLRLGPGRPRVRVTPESDQSRNALFGEQVTSLSQQFAS